MAMRSIVLVHAFGSSRRAWEPQVRALSDRHRVLAIDLPGHGDREGPFTPARAVESVRAAIDEAGGTADVVGISGGAVVALLTCLEHPARVSGLVLSGGLARTPRWFAVQRTIARLTPEPVLVRLVRGMYAGGRPEYERTAEEDFRRCGKRTYLAGLDALAGLDLRPRLSEVSVPALVLCGARDRANIPLSRNLAQEIRTAELRIVPDATHLWNLQQPDVFNRTVAEFADRTA
jgi:3-oxoadipate enol-lactonase